MWKKRLLTILLALVGLCIAASLFLLFYLDQNLYIKPESDEDLIATLLDLDLPGFAEISVLDSQGEGIRRIPREILISVEMLSFPEPIVCDAMIYFDVGDPMALNLQWQTLECIGYHRWIVLTQLAYHYSLKPTDCHQDRIVTLMAHWVQNGVIQLDEIIGTETQERVAVVVEQAKGLALGETMDAGLFNLDDAVTHSLVAEEDHHYTAYVLRCDGTLDAYLMDGYGKTYSVASVKAGDYVLPDTVR